MGTDIDTIMSSPIGQPMATVRFPVELFLLILDSGVDILQQLWYERDTCGMVYCRHDSVSCRLTQSETHNDRESLLGS